MIPNTKTKLNSNHQPKPVLKTCKKYPLTVLKIFIKHKTFFFFYISHPVLDTNLAVKLEKTSIDESTTTLTMDSLNSCINSINSQPSRINAACTYYINDSNSCITSSSISPDTSLISFTNDNSSIYLYKLNESVQSIFPEPSITTNKNNFQELLGGHSNVVFKSEFTHDSKYLLSCGADNISCLWDVNNSGEKQARQVCAYSGHLYPVWDLGVFSRLNLFSTASKDSTARLWSFERLYPLRVYCGHQSDVNCVRFHPNGAYLATGKL
jgi:transcription initiation factor TFIID subunit 5